MPAIVFLFVAATGTFGYLLWSADQRRRRAEGGQPTPPWGEEGHVDSEYLGDGAVVKVYYEHNAYSAHVYWNGEYLGQASGFNDVPAAVGWGRSFARSKGADV